MATVLTDAATIQCVHAGAPGTGTAALGASQERLTVRGSPVLVGDDLTNVTITGCTLTGPPGTKPCAHTASTLTGGAARLTAGGAPVLLDTASGATDSTPPGTWTVVAPGQSTLHAD
ncbi:hypothetical protein WEI85_35740 [Actinomycetes bacterium KLBMP 9797]